MKYITAICSAVVWGSGQLINKQKLKGLIFFLLQVGLVSFELLSGTFDLLAGNVAWEFRNAGFFIKGIWGLFTLGSLPRTSSSQKIFDHSVMLMITGLIAGVILILFIIMYIWNIRDAYKTRKSIEAGEETVTSIKYIRNLWDKSFEYIVITPAMLLILFISVIPIMFAFLVVFTNYNANFIPPKSLVSWTGFQTMFDIIRMPIWSTTFVNVFTWTVFWAFTAAFSTYFLGLLQAVILNSEVVKFKKLWRSIFILPWAIPAFISLLVFRAMLNNDGAINQMLISAGLIQTRIPFLSSTFWARLSIIFVNLWIGFPYFMALISSILTTVSQELYEAASIDGANAWHKFKSITMPVVFQSTSPLLIFSITFNFNNFGTIYFLTRGEPLNPSYQMAGTTDILITWIFKLTLDQRMYNYASAMSIIIFIILATVTSINLVRTQAFKEE